MNLEIRERLARIVDILQENGEENPIANIEQVCHLIFVKIIDEEESNREVKAINTVQRKRWTSDLIFAGQCRRYRWSEWGNRSGAYSQEFEHGFAFYLNTFSHQFEHFALIQAFSRDCLCLLNEF